MRKRHDNQRQKVRWGLETPPGKSQCDAKLVVLNQIETCHVYQKKERTLNTYCQHLNMVIKLPNKVKSYWTATFFVNCHSNSKPILLVWRKAPHRRSWSFGNLSSPLLQEISGESLWCHENKRPAKKPLIVTLIDEVQNGWGKFMENCISFGKKTNLDNRQFGQWQKFQKKTSLTNI